MAYYINTEDFDTRWSLTDRESDGGEVFATKEKAIERLEGYRDGIAAACNPAIAEIKAHIEGQPQQFS